MLIKKVQPYFSDGKKYKTCYIWASDGWTYDSARMVRRKYLDMGNNIFEMIEEKYTKAVFSGVEYVEDIDITVVSDSPRVWIEMGTDISDMFEEVTELPPLGDIP